jgi:hypothetical protein
MTRQWTRYDRCLARLPGIVVSMAHHGWEGVAQVRRLAEPECFLLRLDVPPPQEKGIRDKPGITSQVTATATTPYNGTVIPSE